MPTLPVRPPRRTFYEAGLNNQLSDVDEVVFGVDMDHSNDAVKDVRASKHFAQAFGMTSKEHNNTFAPKPKVRLEPPQPPEAPNFGSFRKSFGLGPYADEPPAASVSGSPPMARRPFGRRAPPPKGAGRGRRLRAGAEAPSSQLDRLRQSWLEAHNPPQYAPMSLTVGDFCRPSPAEQQQPPAIRALAAGAMPRSEKRAYEMSAVSQMQNGLLRQRSTHQMLPAF